MKMANYGKLLISVKKAEATESEVNMDIKMKNNASVQTIIFPDEEIRLIADNKIIALQNYKIENNLDIGQESEGRLVFKVSGKPKKMTLQFGKSSMPKTNIEL